MDNHNFLELLRFVGLRCIKICVNPHFGADTTEDENVQWEQYDIHQLRAAKAGPRLGSTPIVNLV